MNSFSIDFSRGYILEVASKLLPEACKIDGRGRTGGCLCVADELGNVLICEQIGTVDDIEALAKYRRNCKEKALRTIVHLDHVSSWESRDEQAEKWGGGIKTDTGFAFAFSGLTEKLDEAFSAATAFNSLTHVSGSRWGQIALISDNRHMNTLGKIVA